jgi:hypothetical protein
MARAKPFIAGPRIAQSMDRREAIRDGVVCRGGEPAKLERPKVA